MAAIIRQATGSLGATRVTDWYSFTLGSAQTVDIDLSATPGAATLFLYSSTVASGQMAVESAGPGNDGWINLPLTAGTYYVGVSSAAIERYALTLTTGVPTVGFSTTKLAGGSQATAKDLGLLGTPGVSVAEWVGPTNPSDWYRFTLADASAVAVTVAGVTRAVTGVAVRATLLDSAGQPVPGATNVATAASNGSITATLAAGTYFIGLDDYDPTAQKASTVFATGYSLSVAMATALAGGISPGGASITTAVTLGALTGGAGSGVREGYGYRGATITTDAAGNHFVGPGTGISDGAGATGPIQLIDGRLVYDPADPAAKVARLYQAALGRAADSAGLVFWTARLQAGAPLDTLSASFLGSAEFNARYGGLDTAGFVGRLYQNVLGRAPDPAGQAFWIDSLNRGLSRAGALSSFSESVENKAATASLVAAGIWLPDSDAAEVARLYDTVFGRKPDLGGLTSWTAALNAGTTTLPQVTDAFMASAEFRAVYGSLSNAAFAQSLYINTLGRTGDSAGLAFWTGSLDRAALSRAAVVLSFSDSAEHVARTAAAIGGDLPGQRGIQFA